MTRGGLTVALLLVLAFVAHDGWMVVAVPQAGHIAYAAGDDAAAMGEHPHAGHHRAVRSNLARTGEATAMTPMPSMPMTTSCAAIRTGTLGQPTNAPDPANSGAVLPLPDDVSDRARARRQLGWRPPGQAPDVRRAFLQVYRE
jgi:hypothetical protein